MPALDPVGSPPGGGAVFATTHWSVIVEAGRQESAQSSAALEQLCRAYWYPLYAYVRRKGHSPDDAQDLTQEFFARLLAKNYLAGLDRRKGKFRSFLLASLEHFLAKEWTRRRMATPCRAPRWRKLTGAADVQPSWRRTIRRSGACEARCCAGNGDCALAGRS